MSSAGLWPGDGPGGGLGEAHVYSYAYPAPEGFSGASVQPAEARWDDGLGEFVLPYEAVRTAADPDAALLAFLQSTYEAAADLAGWDREAPRLPGPRGVRVAQSRGDETGAVWTGVMAQEIPEHLGLDRLAAGARRVWVPLHASARD